MISVSIRGYEKQDRKIIRKICYETALMGDSANSFFTDSEILADAVTSYYTDYEPESAFVAECDGIVVGYLTGCINTMKFYKMWLRRILPKLAIRFILRGNIYNAKNLKFLYHNMMGFLKGEFRRPYIYNEYPAHFHINIIRNYRKMGIGTKLTRYFLEYLRIKDIRGVSLVTISDGARIFFEKMNFQLIYSHSIIHISHITKRVNLLYIFAKNVSSIKDVEIHREKENHINN